MTAGGATLTDSVAGVVLAGGRARRMSGVDKGLIQLRGKALAQRALQRLSPQVGAVCINANRHQEEYAAFGCPVVADEIQGYGGPLAGLHAAMKWAASTAGAAWVLSVPCDTPFFPSDLVARLAAAQQEKDADVAVAIAAGVAQPVFLLARTSLADHLADSLAQGDGKIMHWCRSLPYAEAHFPDLAMFDNINTAEDLAAAESVVDDAGTEAGR